MTKYFPLTVSIRAIGVILAVALGSTATLADPVYYVNVNTSAIEGLTGFLDFQFNPGFPQPPSGTVTISGFASDGALGAASLDGNVSGTLATSVVIVNDPTTLMNDYYTPFTFGASLSFTFAFSGPAVSAPDGMSGTSTFVFSMLDNGNPNQSGLLTNSPFGFAFTADLGNDGTVSLANDMTTGDVGIGEPVAVPEPAPGLMLASLLVSVVASRILQRSRRLRITGLSES